jgi:hypothetical protein
MRHGACREADRTCVRRGTEAEGQYAGKLLKPDHLSGFPFASKSKSDSMTHILDTADIETALAGSPMVIVYFCVPRRRCVHEYEWQNEVSSDYFATGFLIQWQNEVSSDSFCHFCSYSVAKKGIL